MKSGWLPTDTATPCPLSIALVKRQKDAVLAEIRACKQRRVEAERAKGEHWRSRIFEKNPTDADHAERTRLTSLVEEAIAAIDQAKRRWRELQARQDALVADPEVLEAHDRRRNIELESELKRLTLIRNAIITAKGLEHAGHRPAAWWFPIVCPDGRWFRETVRRARYYLEPLR